MQCVSYNSLTEWQEVFYSTFGIAALYLIPLVIIICCYARILWEIYRRSKESTEGEIVNVNKVGILLVFNYSADMQSSRNLIRRTESDSGTGGSVTSSNGRPRGARNNSYVSNGRGKNNNKFHLRRSDLAQIEKARIRTLRMTIIIVLGMSSDCFF